MRTPGSRPAASSVLARYPDVMSSPQPLDDDLVVDRRFTDRVFDDDG